MRKPRKTESRISHSARAVKNKVARKAPKAKAKTTKRTGQNSTEIENFTTLKLKYLELLKKVENLEKKVNQGTNEKTTKPGPKTVETVKKAQPKSLSNRAQTQPSSLSVKNKQLGSTSLRQTRQSHESNLFGRRQTRQSIAADLRRTRASTQQKTESVVSRSTIARRKTQSKVSKPVTVKGTDQENDKPVNLKFKNQVPPTAVNRTCRIVPRPKIQVEVKTSTDNISYSPSQEEHPENDFSGRTSPVLEDTGLDKATSEISAFDTNTVSKIKDVPEEHPIIIFLSEPDSGLPLYTRAKKQNSTEKFDFQFRFKSRCTVPDKPFRTICRVCGRHNVYCTKIFEEGSQISKLMCTFLPIESITELDPLPLTICLDCAGVLQATDDLAFRCFITEPLFRQAGGSVYPNIIAMIDVMDEAWRSQIKNKVIDKFMTRVLTIYQRLQGRCNISETIMETCHICGQPNMRCLESCSENLFMAVINTYLPFEFPESKRESFHACLECVGTLEVMDDLSFRFFNVESCLRQHYNMFKTVELSSHKDVEETTDKNLEVVERPSGMFPNYDAIAAAAEVDDTPVHTVDENISFSPVEDISCSPVKDINFSPVNNTSCNFVEDLQRHESIVNLGSSSYDHSYSQIQSNKDRAIKPPRTYVEKIQLLQAGSSSREIVIIPRKPKDPVALSTKEQASPTNTIAVQEKNATTHTNKTIHMNVEQMETTDVKEQYLLSKFLSSSSSSAESNEFVYPFGFVENPSSQFTQHQLMFRMKLWLFPSRTLPSALYANPQNEKSSNGRSLNTKATVKTPHWIVDFKYAVYYDCTNGVYFPHHFKLYPGNRSELAEKCILQTVQEVLRHEKTQILKHVDENLVSSPALAPNPLGDTISKVILHNSILCVYCNILIPATNLLSHFKKKHTIKCVDCNEHLLSPDSLFNHLTMAHSFEASQCTICSRKFMKGSTFICKHRFSCNLCKRNFHDYASLIKHEEEHYLVVVDLSKTFKRLYDLPADVAQQVYSMKRSTLVDACSVCGKDQLGQEKECSHTFSCDNCHEVSFNHVQFLLHRCNKPSAVKLEPKKEVFTKLIFSCPICWLNITEECEYQIHYEKCLAAFLHKSCYSPVLMENDSKLLPVRCSLCSVVFPTMIDFYCHYFTCLTHKTYACDSCMEMVFIADSKFHSCKPKTSIQSLNKHTVARSEINLDVTPFFECYVCMAGFSNASLLIDHFRTVHPPRDKKCPICNAVFESYHLWTIIRHLKQHCAKSMKEISAGSEKETDFKCGNCNHFLQSHLSKIIHTIIHHSSSMLFCTDCEEKFISAEAAKAHNLTCMTRKKWTCELCDHTFTSLGDFQHHSTIHFRSLSCTFCKIVFKSRTYLGVHLRVAHPEKSYVCKFCSRIFVFAESLRRHYKAIHRKDIQCCSNCYKTFRTKEELLVHSSEHGDWTCICSCCSKKKVQPPVLFYSCDTCCETFDRALDLYSHNLKMHPKLLLYHCASCNQGFHCSKTYQTHRDECAKAVTNSEFFLCENCGESFTDKEDMENHRLSHESLPRETSVEPAALVSETVDKPEENTDKPEGKTDKPEKKTEEPKTHYCPLCDISFKNNNYPLIIRHCRSHDPIQVLEICCGFKTGPLKCTMEFCDKKFSSKIQRFLHEIYHHDKLLYKCQVCYAEFDDHSSWTKHEKRCLYEQRQEHVPTKDQIKIVLSCKFCTKTFSNQQALVAHTNSIHCMRSFECDICHRTYSCLAYLDSHKKNIHTDGNYLCPDCGKKFTARKRFLFHISRHESAKSKKQFLCKLCDTALLSAAGLKNHERCHVNKKNYFCEHCSMQFLHKYELGLHRKSQHKEFILKEKARPRPLKNPNYNPLMNYCKVCKVYFQCLNDMRAHCSRSVETGTYICGFGDCGLKFTSECSLNYHARYHKSGLVCELCDKSFTTLNVHRLHSQLEHNDIYPFHCDHCNRGFSSEHFLKSHRSSCNPLSVSGAKGSSNKENEGKEKAREVFSCNHCAKLFNHRYDLSIHFKCAHKDATNTTHYTCKVCGSCHNSYVSLMNHTRFHYRSADKPGFCCPVCAFSDSKLQTLINHSCGGDNTNHQDHVVNTARKRKPQKRKAEISEEDMNAAANMIEEFVYSLSEEEPASSAIAIHPTDINCTSSYNMEPSCGDQSMLEESCQDLPADDPSQIAFETDKIFDVHTESETQTVMLDDNFVYVCSFCENSFDSVSVLQTHLSLVHNLNLNDLELQLVT